jgi:hypothetical protein
VVLKYGTCGIIISDERKGKEKKKRKKKGKRKGREEENKLSSKQLLEISICTVDSSIC